MFAYVVVFAVVIVYGGIGVRLVVAIVGITIGAAVGGTVGAVVGSIGAIVGTVIVLVKVSMAVRMRGNVPSLQNCPLKSSKLASHVNAPPIL